MTLRLRDADIARAHLSERLTVGSIYTRDDLKSLLETNDSTLNTGIFQPAGFDSVLLFVTEKKTADRTQYADRLEGDVLHWQGQTQGRKDALIVEHGKRGLELLLFYRLKKNEHPHGGFKYEGAFDYESREGARPASFVLRRGEPLSVQVDAEVEAESDASRNAEAIGAFDPSSTEDARKRTFAAIVVRRGQPAFRRKLLKAYDGRCALTGCDVEEVLEAAHICRYMGDETNVVSNGLLLRADVHTLYDSALIAIDPDGHRVIVAPKIRMSKYAFLEGCELRLPDDRRLWPSPIALLKHWMLVRSIWDKKKSTASDDDELCIPSLV
jgi:putative restriction endonuclease